MAEPEIRCPRSGPPCTPGESHCTVLTLVFLSQGQQFHRDGPASRTSGGPRYRLAPDGTQSSPRKASLATAGPQHWQPKGSPIPRTLPDPRSPRPARNTRILADSRATEERPSPFGIPYSKLSQSKHLKARSGGSQWAPSDSKRRAQTPRDHKDP